MDKATAMRSFGNGAFKQSRTFGDFAERHSEFLNRYRAKDWDAAESLRRDCERINTAGLHRLYALYRERIAFFRQNPSHPTGTGPQKR